jgi:hypothetical protein
METSEPAGRNRTLVIVAVVALVLLCACLVLAIVGFFSFITIRSAETQEFPVEEFPSVVTQEVVTPTSDASLNPPGFEADPGEPPTGGLGNDILRDDTWQYVAAAAVGQGCDQPIGEDSTIEVLQEPDASGVWVEQWTVACESGDSYAFEVEYILDATGATFNIRSLP